LNVLIETGLASKKFKCHTVAKSVRMTHKRGRYCRSQETNQG